MTQECTYDFIDKVIFDENLVNKTAGKLAEYFSSYYGDEEVVVLTVLNGGCYFRDLLFSHPSLKEKKNFQHSDILAKSYYLNKKTKIPTVKINSNIDLSGKIILVIDDIYDSGETLDAIRNMLKQSNPQRVDYAVIVVREKNRDAKMNSFNLFSCFRILINDFLVGCGMDFNDGNRELPFIATIKKELIDDGK